MIGKTALKKNYIDNFVVSECYRVEHTLRVSAKNTFTVESSSATANSLWLGLKGLKLREE